MSKHPLTDDFSELLSVLTTAGDFLSEAAALATMGMHVEDKQVPNNSQLQMALGNMMDLFEPTIAECVEQDNYYLSPLSDDLMFCRGALYNYLLHQASSDIATTAQHIWGIDMPPVEGESYFDYCQRLLPVFEAKVQKTEILEEVSMSIRTAKHAARKAM